MLHSIAEQDDETGQSPRAGDAESAAASPSEATAKAQGGSHGAWSFAAGRLVATRGPGDPLVVSAVGTGATAAAGSQSDAPADAVAAEKEEAEARALDRAEGGEATPSPAPGSAAAEGGGGEENVNASQRSLSKHFSIFRAATLLKAQKAEKERSGFQDNDAFTVEMNWDTPGGHSGRGGGALAGWLGGVLAFCCRGRAAALERAVTGKATTHQLHMLKRDSEKARPGTAQLHPNGDSPHFVRLLVFFHCHGWQKSPQYEERHATEDFAL